MNKSLALFFCISILSGCAATGKYIEPRSVLDKSLYYRETDTQGKSHEISSDPSNRNKIRVPQPTLIDSNSIVEIIVSKEQLAATSSMMYPLNESEGLLNRKKRVVKALDNLKEVVKARRVAIESYQSKNIENFESNKKKAASMELEFIDKLSTIWLEETENYYRMEKAYDPPSYKTFQDFLKQEIVALEAADRAMADQLKNRARTLTLEAFLNRPGKDTVAIHLDGYDLIKEGELGRIDRFGLNLSPEERERLKTQVEATQNIASALENLRLGEKTLNEAVQEIRSSLEPEIAAIMDEATSLYEQIMPNKIKERIEITKNLLKAYSDAVKAKNKALWERIENALTQNMKEYFDKLLNEFIVYAPNINAWISSAKALKDNLKKATPAMLVDLINATADVVKNPKVLKETLPNTANSLQEEARKIFESLSNELKTEEKDILLNSAEAIKLKSNLNEYIDNFQSALALAGKFVAILEGASINPIAELPHSAASFKVPVEDVKNTFINLEQTPRLPGDMITLKATLRDGEKVIDSTSALFQVDTFGYYAELSPSIVLIKPKKLTGGYDGFRFSSVLSWMHHWSPRPEESCFMAGAFRSLDPSLGIHSAFMNFNSQTSNDSVQIGLGLTFSVWKNRLQIGAGLNLMAHSSDEGKYYYFIGSDLIGLLQTIGIVNH